MKRSSKDLAAQISSVYTEDHFVACRTPGRNQDHPFAGFCCERPGDKGLFAISVPVHSASGEPAAALGVAYPIGFLDSSLRTSLLRTLRLYAHEIGYVGVELSTEAERHMMSQRS